MLSNKPVLSVGTESGGTNLCSSGQKHQAEGPGDQSESRGVGKKGGDLQVGLGGGDGKRAQMP